MNKTLLSLQTPCGIIQIEDYYGNHIPFKIKRNDFNWDYGIQNGNILLKRVTTDTNYLIIVEATVLKLGIEYKIFLSGTTLNYGDSDERTYCVSGYSNGYCIAIGCYSPNDDEKELQDFIPSFSHHGYFHYDESKFAEYDVEMLKDYSGFRFHLIDHQITEIAFPVAWIKYDPGYEDQYEGAVQLWTT